MERVSKLHIFSVTSSGATKLDDILRKLPSHCRGLGSGRMASNESIVLPPQSLQMTEVKQYLELKD